MATNTEMKKGVTVLCGGPTGSGKSTLLNSLVGIEESAFDVGGSLERSTTGVCQETCVRNGITITLWDTPGLEREDRVDEACLKDIRKKCQDYDIFLYCVQGNMDKATELLGEKSSLAKFTKLFGPKLWENGVIAITQANRVVVDYKMKKKLNPSSIDIDKSFQDRIDEWKKHIQTALTNAGVEPSLVREIPILPAGYAKKFTPLPGHEHWLSELRNQFIARMKIRSRSAFMTANEIDSELKKDLERLKKEVSLTAEKFESARKNREIMAGSVTDELEKLNRDVKILNAKICDLQEELQHEKVEKKRIILAANMHYCEVKLEICNLQEKLKHEQDQKGHILQLSERLKYESQAIMKKLRTEIQDLREELDEKGCAVDLAEQQKHECQKSVENLTTEIHDLQDKLECELEKKSHAVNLAEQQKQEYQGSVQKLKEEMHNLREELECEQDVKNQAVELAEQQKHDYHTSVQELKSEICNLQEELKYEQDEKSYAIQLAVQQKDEFQISVEKLTAEIYDIQEELKCEQDQKRKAILLEEKQRHEYQVSVKKMTTEIQDLHEQLKFEKDEKGHAIHLAEQQEYEHQKLVQKLRSEIHDLQVELKCEQDEKGHAIHLTEKYLRESQILMQGIVELESNIEQLEERLRLSQEQPEIDFHLISRSQVTKKEEISRGSYGIVSKGNYCGYQVAIKEPHPIILSNVTISSLRREVGCMAKVHHPNLVTFIGAVFDSQPIPMIIIELMDMNLRFLYKEVDLSKNQMMVVFQDIAYALHYLHEFREPIIHRDLSAPNVLLKSLPHGQYIAKVSDFGSANFLKLSKTSAPGAIVYSAPEMFPPADVSISRKKHTVKVDTFSYGILLCEVIIRKMPDPDTRPEMLNEAKQKWRDMHELIMDCIKAEPMERPAMSQILTFLRVIERTL